LSSKIDHNLKLEKLIKEKLIQSYIVQKFCRLNSGHPEIGVVLTSNLWDFSVTVICPRRPIFWQRVFVCCNSIYPEYLCFLFWDNQPNAPKPVDTTVPDLTLFKETPHLTKFHKYRTTKGDTIYVQKSNRYRSKKSDNRAQKIVEEEEEQQLHQ
jgi:hypothetical protein